MLVFVRIAIRNIVKHKSRSIILGGAIAAVTVLLVLMTNITSGIQASMMRGSTTLFSGHVNIAGFYKINVTSAAPMVTETAKIRAFARENIPEAQYVVDRVNGFGKIISDSATIMMPLMGIDVVEEKDILKELKTVSGNIFDLPKGAGLILFKTQADKLKVTTGDTVTISMPTYRNMNNTKDLKVVAVLKDLGFLSNFSAFMTKQDMREIYQISEDSTGKVMVFLKSPNKMKGVENRLREIIPKAGWRLMDQDPQPFWMKFDKVAGEGWTGQKIDVTNWEDEVAMMKWIITLFDVLTGILTAVLLTIVVLGLMNMLWIAIKERTGEIGTMRAIGTQRYTVVGLFIIEPFILSVCSTVVGIVLGNLVSLLLDLIQIPVNQGAMQAFLMSDTLSLSYSWERMLLIFVSITLFTTLGAMIPAWISGRLKPVIAMSVIE